MAEDSDLEKTESASPRRLQKAREEGQVPQSRDLSAFLVLITGVAMLYAAGGWAGDRMMALVRRGFTLDRRLAFDPQALGGRLWELASEGLLTIAPLMAVAMVASVAGPFLIGGFVFSTKSLEAKLERLDPLAGLGRMFSLHGVAELVKSVLKSLLVGGVGGWVLWRERDHLFALVTQPLEAGMGDFRAMVLLALLLVVLSLGLIVALDVPFQLWQYHKNLRMTKEDVRQESKEDEGDPQIKAQIRRAQREMSRRRMMAEVPKADVVVTNPTHYAVALKYDPEKAGAPVVVAKGKDEVAARIRELAKENNVPMLSAPPLARALYKHCALEAQIPAALFTVVAEVMAWVMQLNHFVSNGGLPPETPSGLAVPDGMDPGAEP